MILAFSYLLVSTVFGIFECPFKNCESSYLGDQYCDASCNNRLCNFDSPDLSSDRSEFEIFQSSDCYVECLLKNCTAAMLQNDHCDPQCNNIECAYDLGKCGFCAPGCEEEMIKNSVCDSECSYETCSFDNFKCGYCADGCFEKDLKGSNCDPNCNTALCSYELSNQCFERCAENCPAGWVGDGICDDECNFKECDYDRGDCLCSKDCTFSMLNESCTGPDDPCNTYDCGFKLGNCGYCASGCYLDMLGNGECNLECLNTDCSYDLGDCECDSECYMTYDGSAWTNYQNNSENVNCFVPKCYYNIGNNPGNLLIRRYALTSLLNHKWTPIELTNYTDTCTEQNFTNFDDLSVYDDCPGYSDCYNEDGLWCMGSNVDNFTDCLRASDSACLVCTGFMVFDVCNDALTECPLAYKEVTELSELFNNDTYTVNWCLPDVTKHSSANPLKYYVAPTDTPTIDGDGSELLPFQSLFYAFTQVYTDFTEIILKEGTHYYQYDSGIAQLYRANAFDPLRFTSKITIYEIRIIGENPDNPSTLYWSAGEWINYKLNFLKISSIAKKIKLANLIISGSKILVDCPFNNDYCTYCPAVIVYYDYNWDYHLLNDRKELFDATLAEDIWYYAIQCLDYGNFELFAFDYDAEIQNVKFLNFTNQFKSFISAKGKLSIVNTTFSRMQAKPGGSIIDITCTSNCKYLDFSYSSGLVEDINYGYEVTDSIETGNFLKINTVRSIKLDSVEFKFCFMYSYSESSYDSSLISITNFNGTFSIINCTFLSIYANSLIDVDVIKLKYSDPLIFNGISNAYSQMNFLLQNSTFSDIYTSNNFINYQMKSMTHNIYINNIEVFNSHSGQNSLINLNFAGMLKSKDKEGGSSIFEGEKYSILPRSVKVENLFISNSTAGLYLLNIATNPNVQITNLTISSLLDGNYLSVFDIITNFNENKKYLSRIPREDQVESLNCKGAINIESSYKVNITDLDIDNIYCAANLAPGGIIIKSPEGYSVINNSSFSNMLSESSEATAISISDTTFEIQLNNLTLSYLFNNDGSVIEFHRCSNIIIKNLTVSEIASYNSPPIYVYECVQFVMNEFSVSGSYSRYGDGGFIQFMASTKFDSKIEIGQGTVFNSSSYGFGGVFIFDALTAAKSQSIFIDEIVLEDCYADSGTFFYITRKIKIKSSGINNIEASKMYGNGSLVLDMHFQGELLLSNWSISESSLFYPAIFATYAGKFSTNALSVYNLTINNCNEAALVFYFKALNQDTKVLFEDLSISNILGPNSMEFSDTFSLTSIVLNIENLIVDSMNTLLLADDRAEIVISGANISNIENFVVKLSKSSYFECGYCQILENYGTIFTAVGNSTLNIHDSVVKLNYYDLSSVSLLEIDSSGTSPNKIYNTTISDNVSLYSDLFKLTNTNLELTDSTISANEASNSLYSGIFALRTNLTVVGCNFQDQYSLAFGAFIYGTSNSQLVIYDSLFNYSAALVNGGAIYAKECKFLNIFNCEFTNNLALGSGGAIYTEKTNVSIEMTEFSYNYATSGSDLYLVNSSYEIKDSKFLYSQYLWDPPSLSMYLIGDSLKLNNVNLLNTSRHVSGIYAEGFLNIEIDDCRFENIWGDTFGAMKFVGNNKNGSVTITNSKFQKNRGEERGGAIILNDMSINIHDSYIYWNQAGIDGGGLFLTTPKCESCVFNISGNSTLVRNHAQSEGGAMKWADFKPFEGENITIGNNTAMYGGDRASSPAILRSKFRMLTEANYTEQIGIIPPGQVFNDTLEIHIYDTYGEIIVTDNTSSLNIETFSELFFLNGEVTFTALEGTFYITGFKPYAEPGSTRYIRAYTNSIKNVKVKNDDTVYQNDFYIRVDFRPCENGEQIGETSCLVCVEPRYLIEPAKTCIMCPTGGDCKGGDKLYVKKNYYRTNPLSHMVYPCQLDGTCLGNDQGYNTSCLTGYSGITCAVCESGYTKAGNGKCNKCPSPALNFIILIGIMVGVVFICIVLVKSSIKSAFVPKAKHSIYIKIFTNYLQLVFLTAQFNLSWPSYVIVLFGIQKSAATATDSIFSIDCYLSANGESSSSDAYFFKMIFYAVLPLGIFIISILVWIGICTLKETYIQLKRELPLTMIVIFFLVYPNIVKFMFSHFACTEFDMLGKFLNDNYSVKCWTTKHQKYSLYVALPSIILWSIGVPTLVLIAMIKNRKVLYKEDNKIRFGFLFNGYKTSIFYWEFIIMYRKILIICVIVFIADISNAVQGLTVTLLLIFSLFIQYEIAPYNSHELNHMEVEALITASLTIYCGLYYLTNDINEIFKLFLFIIIVVGNCYFIILWLYWMIKAVVDMIVKIVPSLRHVFRKGDAFEDEFNKEELVMKGTYYDHSDGRRHYTFFNKADGENPQFKFNEMQDLYKSVFDDEVEDKDLNNFRSNVDETDLIEREKSEKTSVKSSLKEIREPNSENKRKSVKSLKDEIEEESKTEKKMSFEPEVLKRNSLKNNSLKLVVSQDEIDSPSGQNSRNKGSFNMASPANDKNRKADTLKINREDMVLKYNSAGIPETEELASKDRTVSMGSKPLGDNQDFTRLNRDSRVNISIVESEGNQNDESPLIKGGSVYISEADEVSPY